MQSLGVSGAVRPIYGSLGVKRLTSIFYFRKRKVDPVHVRKAYTGTGGTAPRILTLGTRWRWVQLHAPIALLPGNTPVSTEAGWARESVSTCWIRDNLLQLSAFETCTAHPVACPYT